MVLGLRYFSDRVGEGAGQPVLNADIGEEFMHVQPGVSIVLGTRPPESPGTLYITTKYSLVPSPFFSFVLLDPLM